MRKLKLFKTLLVVAGMLVGGSSVWAENMTTMTGRLGLSDNSGDFGAYATKVVTIDAGESYVYTFINYNDGASEDQLYHNWYAEIRNTSNQHCGDVRADGHNWVWPDANNSGTLTGSYTGDNSTTISSDVAVWAQAYNGVTVTVTVTRSDDGNTVTVAHTATTIAVGDVVSKTYSGTYSCSGFGTNEVSVILANEKSHQQITKVVYTKADGGSIFVAPDHTAGAQWGGGYNGEYESTVDAAAEFYNNDGANASSGWYGCAYAKFTYAELPNSNYTITDATLTYNTNQGGKSARDDKIYYMNADFDLDWANFAGQKGKGLDLRNTSYRGSNITVNTGATGIRTNLTGNVTTFLQTIAASQKYILFQWTGNAGGANLYGNGATDYNAPELAITYTTATTYTATFTANSGAITPAVTIYSDAGRTSSVENGTLTNGTKYYYRAVLEGYKDYEGEFTVSGSNPSVSFTMTAKAVYNYTVKGVDGSSNDLGNIASGSTYEGEAVSVAYPRWILNGTTLYSSGSGTVTYSTTFTPDADNYVEEINYNSGTVSNVVFYTEGEDVVGASEGANAARASKGKMGYTGSATTYLDATTLSPGKYQIYMRAQNGNSSARAYNFKVNENVVLTGEFANGTNTDANSAEFTVYETSTLSFASVGSGQSGIDYFYVVKTGDAITISSAGWATLYTPYALNFADVTGLTAYTATCDGTKVTLTPVENVPANTGVVLKGAANTYSIPVIASSTTAQGDLKGSATEDKAFDTNNDYYYLAMNGDEAQFTKLTSGSIAAGKAYLELPHTDARTLKVVFDESTGIEAIESVKKSTDNKAYNLNGQRVAQPSKGLYIMNGKKVILK